MKNQNIQPTKIVVDIAAKIPKNDIFYVYYLQEGIKTWSDDHSTYLRVKGSNVLQNLQFEIPVDKRIEKIRIDIGGNKKQLPIEIKSVAISSETNKIILTDSLNSYFNLNIYTTQEEGTYFTKEVDGRYDPFLISKNNLRPTLDKLREPRRMFADRWIYIFAIVFSLAIGFSIAHSLTPKKISYFSLVFVTIILTPLLIQLTGVKLTHANLEKRVLSKWPSIEPLTEFPNRFETYYNDNFGLRHQMIDIAGQIKTTLFRSSPKPELVQFGKNEFLFYNSLTEEIYTSYTHNNLLAKKDLEKYYETFKTRKDSLAKKGINYIFGFWPNKHSIYNEKLPNSMSAQIVGDMSLADQITTQFKKNNELFIDVRQNLKRDKKDKLLYRKFDTHWNTDGAYLGYRAFCQQTFPILGLTPLEPDDFTITYDDLESGDLTKQMGVDKIWGFKESVPKYVLKTTDYTFEIVTDERFPKGSTFTKNPGAANNKKVLLFRDSFTTQLVQFLSLHFAEVVYVNEIYDENLINMYKPDVVISCRVERYMLTM